jgi:uncharacterized Tic20 family protein
MTYNEKTSYLLNICVSLILLGLGVFMDIGITIHSPVIKIVGIFLVTMGSLALAWTTFKFITK